MVVVVEPAGANGAMPSAWPPALLALGARHRGSLSGPAEATAWSRSSSLPTQTECLLPSPQKGPGIGVTCHVTLHFICSRASTASLPHRSEVVSNIAVLPPPVSPM